MGKSKKKGKKGSSNGGVGSGDGFEKKKLGRRKQLQQEKLQREENERNADAALAAGLKKMAERGITKDSDLFAPVSPNDDCAICLVPLPLDEGQNSFMSCCGKLVCTADYLCAKALKQDNAARKIKKQPPVPKSCAFCRTEVWWTKEEYVDRMIKRMQANDDKAYFALADSYRKGEIVEKDAQKAFDLTLRGVELGDPKALNALSMEYDQGEFVARNEDRRRACMDASARRGDYAAHYNLGLIELIKNRNMELAVKHYHIAAAAGLQDALNRIREMCQDKHASNEDYLRACRAYQAASAAQSTEERTKWAETKKKTELLLASTI